MHACMHGGPEGRGFKAQYLRLSWWLIKLSDHYWLSLLPSPSQPCSTSICVSSCKLCLLTHTQFSVVVIPWGFLRFIFYLNFKNYMANYFEQSVLSFQYVIFHSCLLSMCQALLLWKPLDLFVVTKNLALTFSCSSVWKPPHCQQLVTLCASERAHITQGAA